MHEQRSYAVFPLYFFGRLKIHVIAEMKGSIDKPAKFGKPRAAFTIRPMEKTRDHPPITDRNTDETREAAIFVAAMGASSYTFCEATWSQSLPDWTGRYVRAFEYENAAPLALVPDNLKCGVTRPRYYDPELNPTYRDLASHHSAMVLPARPYRPRDKPKAEAAVLLARRWILARLGNQRFFSLDELNRSIRPLPSLRYTR